MSASSGPSHLAYPLCDPGAASFTIYTRTKEFCRDHHWFSRNGIFDVAAAGGLGWVTTYARQNATDTAIDLVEHCRVPLSQLVVPVGRSYYVFLGNLLTL